MPIYNKADLKYIYNVIREITDLIDINDNPKLIVTKITQFQLVQEKRLNLIS